MSRKTIIILLLVILAIVFLVPIIPIETEVAYNVTVPYNVSVSQEIQTPYETWSNVLMEWEHYSPIQKNYELSWPFDVEADDVITCTIITYPYSGIQPPDFVLYFVTFENSSSFIQSREGYGSRLEFTYNATLSYTVLENGRIFLVLENRDDWQLHYDEIHVNSSRYRTVTKYRTQTQYVTETRYRIETRYNVVVTKAPLITLLVDWLQTQGII